MSVMRSEQFLETAFRIQSRGERLDELHNDVQGIPIKENNSKKRFSKLYLIFFGT